jgi:hypothetical protein
MEMENLRKQEAIDRYVAKILADAPPLDEERKHRLAAMFSVEGDTRTDDTPAPVEAIEKGVQLRNSMHDMDETEWKRLIGQPVIRGTYGRNGDGCVDGGEFILKKIVYGNRTDDPDDRDYALALLHNRERMEDHPRLWPLYKVFPLELNDDRELSFEDVGV